MMYRVAFLPLLLLLGIMFLGCEPPKPAAHQAGGDADHRARQQRLLGRYPRGRGFERGHGSFPGRPLQFHPRLLAQPLQPGAFPGQLGALAR